MKYFPTHLSTILLKNLEKNSNVLSNPPLLLFGIFKNSRVSILDFSILRLGKKFSYQKPLFYSEIFKISHLMHELFHYSYSLFFWANSATDKKNALCFTSDRSIEKTLQVPVSSPRLSLSFFLNLRIWFITILYLKILHTR